MIAGVALLTLVHHGLVLTARPGTISTASACRRLIAAPCATVISSADDEDDDDDDTDFDGEEEDEAFLRAFDLSLQRAAAGRPGRADAVERGPRLIRSTDGGGRRFTPLDSARGAADDVRASFDSYAGSPSQQLLLGSLALLVGFYVSHAQVLGGGDQGGRWEYVSGAAACYVVERLTSGYYEVPMRRRSPTLMLLHAFKVGFMYGIVLDAIKFGG